MARIEGIEKRVLAVTIAGAGLGTLFMLISVCTDHWSTVTIPDGVWRNSTNSYLLSHHSGLWRICFHETDNTTNPLKPVKREHCRMLKFFASEEEIIGDLEINGAILDYSRSETAFAVISLILAGLAMAFSLYTLREPRYMFKRLAAMLHVMTALCILVCAEVFISSVGYERKNLPQRVPWRAIITYGYSFILAWFAFALFVIATVVFLVLSRKRKGDKARTEQEAAENEPVHLGRG